MVGRVGPRRALCSFVVLFCLALPEVVLNVPVAGAESGMALNRPSATRGGRCAKKFKAVDRRLMCLPSARGSKLTWQKYPVAEYPCPRAGLYAKSAGLVCRKYSNNLRRASASLMWIEPPGPFRYLTIYGNYWKPPRGGECAFQNVKTEWEFWSFTGVASCLPDRTGVVWRWQPRAEHGKPCVRAAVQWGNLVCAKSGGRLRWTKAAKLTRPVEEIIAEAKSLLARLNSIGFQRQGDQTVEFGDSFAEDLAEEFKLRAALAGVTVGLPPLYEGLHVMVIKSNLGRQCFLTDDSNLYRTEGDPGSMYQGSPLDVVEFNCDSNSEAVSARIVARIQEIDSALWSTNDLRAWHAEVIALELPWVDWKLYGRSLIVDNEGTLGRVKADVTVNRSVSPAVPVSTTYKFNDKCFAGARSGSSGTFSEVPCA